MQLQDIPDKVIEDKLFQHLYWNDLLRLRRVCSWSKKIIDGYLKANPERAPELEINEGKDKSFGAFLEMGIPTTKLFINNSTLGHRFYENEEDKVRQFLEDYGPLITDLRVTQITLANNAFCRDKELTFMEGLSNLKSLEVEFCSSGRYGAEPVSPSENPKYDDMALSLALPTTFKKLEKVKIGRDPHNTDLGISPRMKRTRDFLMQCTRLKSISFPTSWLEPVPEGEGNASGTLYGDLVFLVLSFEERPNKFGFELKAEASLEWVDFQNCHENYGEWLKDKWLSSLDYNWHGSKGFLSNCLEFKKRGLKLGNVSPYWYYAKDAPNLDGSELNKDGYGDQVVSLYGLDPIIMDVQMPILEKITIPSTCFCVTGGKRAKWPSLKILDITVDGNKGFCWDFEGVTDFLRMNGRRLQGTDNVFQFLFCNFKRPSVRELTLRFKGDGGKKGNKNSKIPEPMDRERFLKGGGQLRWGIKEELTVPCTRSIVKCCPNLKVVKLGNWQGSNQDLLVFWNGLGEGLEEVELENCGNMADFTFFGKDGENPAFLKLKNLKKLSLKGLDKMNRVTDLLFRRILSQMKLKQLLLTSDKPIEKITKDGIMSLLHGPFAETIEKFPFQGWSLSGVTPKDFEDMGKTFRSYNML